MIMKRCWYGCGDNGMLLSCSARIACDCETTVLEIKNFQLEIKVNHFLNLLAQMSYIYSYYIVVVCNVCMCLLFVLDVGHSQQLVTSYNLNSLTYSDCSDNCTKHLPFHFTLFVTNVNMIT